jgi:hypothetical protein
MEHLMSMSQVPAPTRVVVPFPSALVAAVAAVAMLVISLR